MNRNGITGIDVLVYFHRFLRVNMFLFHEPSWAVGSNGNRSQIEAFEFIPEVNEILGITRISRKEETEFWMLQDPPGPEGLIAIPGASSTPVLDWYCMDLPLQIFLLFPLVHFNHIGNP